MRSQYTIDNEIYRYKGHAWWDDNESVATLRYFMNPLRFAYFQRVLSTLGPRGAAPKTVLDVGCGGGFLSEEFAKAGYAVTGIDPAPESVECARKHALENGLLIDYHTGCGEYIPAETASFDIVLCCDVLEHVENIRPVLGEIAQVLKGGGVFFYDTVNRTLASHLIVIKVLQDWTFTAQHEPRSHVWEKFVRPEELRTAMAASNLIHKEHRGISSRGNIFLKLMYLRRRVKGKATFRELGDRLKLHESDDLRVAYMGYAVKETPPESGKERAFRELGHRLGFENVGDQS